MANCAAANISRTTVTKNTLLTEMKYDLYTSNPTDPNICVSLLSCCSSVGFALIPGFTVYVGSYYYYPL